MVTLPHAGLLFCEERTGLHQLAIFPIPFPLAGHFAASESANGPQLSIPQIILSHADFLAVPEFADARQCAILVKLLGCAAL